MPTQTKEKEKKPSDILAEIIKMNDLTLSPWQKGVKKASEEAGITHFNEGLAAGMDPHQMTMTAGLDGKQLMGALLGSKQQAPRDSLGSNIPVYPENNFASNMQNPGQQNPFQPQLPQQPTQQPMAAMPQQGPQQPMMQQGPQQPGMMQKLGNNLSNNNPLEMLRNLVQQVVNIIPASPEARLANYKIAHPEVGFDMENRNSLIKNRDVETRLMEKQLEGGDTEKVYRDPVTGQEVDPMTAEEDMKNGLGIYQVNQRVSTRAGVVERPLNKVPNLTQEEKKYVNDARMIGESLTTLESGFDSLYDKFGKADWKAFEIDKMPYILERDPDVQSLKSDLVYLKAAIPFLRGGKALTPAEAKRVDIMLSPFGKNRETYKKDLQRFQNEFTAGADIMKFGVNSGLMKKLIKGKQGQSSTEKQPSHNNELQSLKSKYGLQ